jgi:hypothetical protein
MELSDVLLLAGNRIRCRRCSARSKRTKLRCGAPAMSGKKVCASHGAKSTGARTKIGKANSAKANFKHGQYTKQAQAERSEASAQLSQLEGAMYLLGMSDAPRSTGRKAKGCRPITSLDDVRAMLAKTKNDWTSWTWGSPLGGHAHRPLRDGSVAITRNLVILIVKMPGVLVYIYPALPPS